MASEAIDCDKYMKPVRAIDCELVFLVIVIFHKDT